MTTAEPDIYDRLRAIFLNAEKLDSGTQLQLTLMLQSALERIIEDDTEAEQ